VEEKKNAAAPAAAAGQNARRLRCPLARPLLPPILTRSPEAALEIRVLRRHGKGIREIARDTGVSQNTVRRYLRDEEASRYRPRPPRPAKLDPKAYVSWLAIIGDPACTH
jgi:hypothetical protein